MTTSRHQGCEVLPDSTGRPWIPRWLRWSVIALLSWGVWAVMAKIIGDALSGAHNQALSTLGILPVIVALAFTGRSAGAASGTMAKGHSRRGVGCALAAGVLACVGNVFYYNLLSSGGKAAMIVPLTALYPLVTILLAMLWLRERLNRVQLAGVVVSLTSIYLFNVQREAGFISRWLFYALAPIVLWGAAGLLQKLSTNYINGERSALWFLAAFIPFAALFLVGEPLPAQIAASTWLLVTAQGFFLAFGNFAILLAFASQGKASVIAPLAALYPVVSVPIAIFFLGEKISLREGLGILLALVAVTALSWETRAAVRAHVDPASTTCAGR